MKKSLARSRVLTALGSRWFWWATLGFLVFQALWIALTAKYPMAFDEDFHFGIIKLYAHHASPFWASHPADGDAFGAVTRDPSYLYHYVFGFVLRFLRLFTQDQTIQIIILRFINIGLFTGGLVLFRKLLLRTGASKTIVHSCLAIFVLVPTVPLLASQINYDNLFIPLTALSLLLADTVANQLRAKQADIKSIAILVIVCLATSVVKYAFLPIFLAVAIYELGVLYRSYGFKIDLYDDLLASLKRLRWPIQLLLVLGLVVFGGLFIERDGINIARYHRPAPDCADVLTVQQCFAYGPWNRDYFLALSKAPHAARSPIGFTRVWVDGMWLRSFFTLAGPTEDYQTRGPLTVPAQGAIIFGVVGLLVSLVAARRVFKRYNGSLLSMLALVTLIYVAFLWFDTYMLFLHAGQAVAINGRYLLVVDLFLLIFMALSAREVLARVPRLKPVFPVIVLLCMLWGGGVMTYMIRSSDNWYWPGPAPKAVNHAAQKVLVPITPGSAQPVQYLP